MKSPNLSGAVSASTGRRLLADRSVNGNGTSSRSPRSGIVPDFVFGVVPQRGERASLRVHQIAPFRALAALAQEAHEVEDLARQRLGQRLDLLVDHVGNG